MPGIAQNDTFATVIETPKYELRGAWISTVMNLDWPSDRNLSVPQQKQELLEILDVLSEAGFNAVFFQVRPEADALYPSPYEPWSYWLTDRQGDAPYPFYDPLRFAIDEAHKRGMELHAWLNPYRAHRNLNGGQEPHSTHVIHTNPGWILRFRNGNQVFAMMNPALQEVRDHISNVVTDIVRRYNVDGIHFDDYFYPYAPEVTTEDIRDFERDPRGFSDIGDWRRDNVRLMVAQVGDSVRAVDPLVKYGLSPFGIRKNSDAGTSGMEGFYKIYADPLAWVEEQIVDYLAPQLYWERSHVQAPFEPLLNFWSDAALQNGRHIYAGLAPYKLLPPFNWPADELDAQMKLLHRDEQPVHGAIFFRTQNLMRNVKGVREMLASKWFAGPALVPPMEWKTDKEPPPVEQLVYAGLPDGSLTLSWSESPGAVRYAVYAFGPELTIDEIMDHIDEARPVRITGKTEITLDAETASRVNTLLVRAVNRNNIESMPRAIVTDSQ